MGRLGFDLLKIFLELLSLVAQQCLGALNFAAHLVLSFLQSLFTFFRKLIFGDRVGVVVFLDFLRNDFFLLLDIPEIAHVAPV